MVDYVTWRKETFQTRMEAEKWAKEQKAQYSAAEIGVPKIDIDFDTKGQIWLAKILSPI